VLVALAQRQQVVRRNPVGRADARARHGAGDVQAEEAQDGGHDVDPRDDAVALGGVRGQPLPRRAGAGHGDRQELEDLAVRRLLGGDDQLVRRPRPQEGVEAGPRVLRRQGDHDEAVAAQRVARAGA
jgi:hypothetical protein